MINKFLLLLVLVSSISLSAAGQRITIGDLKFGITHSVGETEDYLLKKGLTFGRSDDISDSKPSPKLHQFDKNNHTSNYISVSLYEYKGKIYSCSTTTLKQHEYIFLRNQVKTLGYKIGTSNIEGNTSTIDYTQGNYKVVFIVTKASDGNKMYQVVLEDNKKYKFVLDDLPSL